MQVTSLDQLKNIKLNDIVELPSFDDGTPFVAELKKPNMLMLMAGGHIPNTLLNVAMDIFQHGKGKETINKALNNPKDLKVLTELLIVLAKACLVNPSFKQLEDLGIELNENQLSAILTYAQGGVVALESFRQQQANSESSEPSEQV